MSKIKKLKEDLQWELGRKQKELAELKEELIKGISKATAEELLNIGNYTIHSNIKSVCNRIVSIETRLRVVEYLEEE